MLIILKQSYYLFHKLQLDVVLGAVCVSLWFANICEVHIPSFGLLALALSVWTIYTIDHLLDARHYPDSQRYFFYKKYAKPLSLMLLIGLGLLAGLAFVLPFTLILKGCFITLPIIAYQLLLLHKPVLGAYLKEATVALCYAFGVGIFILEHMQSLEALLILWLFFLAWFSLIMYSHIEKKEELAFGMKNFVYLIGNPAINKLLKALALILILLSFYIGQELLSSISFIITALLMVILTSLLPLFDSKNHRYLGEAVFFTPGLSLLIFS